MHESDYNEEEYNENSDSELSEYTSTEHSTNAYLSSTSSATSRYSESSRYSYRESDYSQLTDYSSDYESESDARRYKRRTNTRSDPRRYKERRKPHKAPTHTSKHQPTKQRRTQPTPTKRQPLQLETPKPLLNVEPQTRQLTKVTTLEMADVAPRPSTATTSPTDPRGKFSLYITKKELIKRFTSSKKRIDNGTQLTPTKDRSVRRTQIEQEICDDREPLALSGLIQMAHINHMVNSPDRPRHTPSQWSTSRSRPGTSAVRMLK